VNQFLLLPLQQILNRDPRRSCDNGRHILARHPIPQHHPRRRRLICIGRCRRTGPVVARLLLEVRNDVVSESRGGFKVSVSLGDLEVDLGLFEFLHEAEDKENAQIS
jgi:hypothetical protein